MRRGLSTLLLLLLAAPAWAKTWVVPGTDTFAAALAATAGDVVQLAAGSYGSLAPTGTGNAAQPVIWIGSGSCTVSGIVPKSYHRFYSITSTASVTMPTDGKRVMFNGCTLGGLTYADVDSSSVRNCTINGNDYTVNRDGAAGSVASVDTLEGCTFPSLNSSGWHAQLYGNTGPAAYVDGFVRRFNQFTVTQSGTDCYSLGKHFRCSNMVSYGNKWTVTSTATATIGGEGDFGMVYRDSSYNLTMKRDTLLFINDGGTLEHKAVVLSSGLGGAYSTSLRGLVVDSCYIRVFRGICFYGGAQATNMKMRYNVFRSRLGRALDFGGLFLDSSNDPYIHHNTIMGKQAVHFGEQANTGGRFSNNIIWGTSSATCAEDQAVGGCSNATPVAISDSNLVYSTTTDSTRAFYYTGGCLAPRVGAWAGQSNDQHSYWGSPAFTDTTWASLNVKPAAGNFALTSNFTLGYAGASDGTSPPPVDSDTVNPYPAVINAPRPYPCGCKGGL